MMPTQMTFDGDEIPANRAQAVKDLFEQAGGELGSRGFARLCIDNGVYSFALLDRAQLTWVQSDIRRILKQPDESGLPFAGQTTERGEDNEPIWKQRRYWFYEDYESNIHEHLRNRDENHNAAVALTRECAARFGRCPFISAIESA
jgi:hypothetical protein